MIANKELVSQNKEKQKSIAKLIIANKKLIAQNEDNEKKANKLVIASKELVFQNNKKEKKVAELGISNLNLKRAEEKVVKANRLYSFISHINKTISHVKDEQTLFNEGCKIAIEQGKFKMAWIGIIDVDHRKIKLVASSGLLKSDSKILANKTYDINGPTEKILQGAKYYIVNDTQVEHKISWSKYAKKRGFNASICLPIKKEGIVIGTFDMYSTKTNFFDIEEIKMLEEVAADITFGLEIFEKDRKNREAEELAMQNEKRFRALIENSSDMKTLTSKEGKILYSSPSIKKILGYTFEELMLKYPQDIIHPEELLNYLENRKEILKTPGKSFHFEQRIQHKNGKWIWCEGILRNMLNEPTINAVVSNFRDISGRKAAEHQQEFDRNNLNALINNTKDLMWSIDKNFKLITFNNPFKEMVKQMSGNTIVKGSNVLTTGFSDEQLTKFKNYYERAFTGAIFSEIEYTQMPFELWSEISYYPIRNGNEIVGTACYSQDITERIKAEQLLKKSEAFNRGIISSLSSHIAVIDDQGKIIAVNESWKRFGVENGETFLHRSGEGMNYFEVCKKSAKEGEVKAAEALQGIKDVLNKKITNFYLEYPCHSLTEQRWFAMRVMRFESDDNMLVVAHENITELKKAERERDYTQVANDELKKIKQDLNNALAKEKDLNELKSRFVAMASHEFRTPLTTMLSSVSLIAKYRELNDEKNQLKHIDKVKTSINNLTDILNEFLCLSKLEEGITENKPERINLKFFITDVVAEMRLMTLEKQKLELNYLGDKMGFMDKKLLKNILHNLISNAIKFSPENGLIEVVVESLKYSIKISVKDNGIGISKQDQKHLFEQFFRGQNATHIQGTGLGLNIVAKYLEQMKGSISFESKENKGTTFTVIIPQ